MKKIFTFIFLFSSLSFYFAQATEICGNGIDDDGDGYLDGYDPDCNSSPPILCFAPASASTFAIQLNVQSPALTIDVSVAPTVGDIDGDGKVEIIAPLGDSTQGYIVYEVNGTTITLEPYKYIIPLHAPVNGTVSQAAIADVNRDGVAEVIAVGDNGFVYVFNHTGGTASVYRARSNVASDTNFGSPRVADIDEDGRPEIIVGNDIFQFNAAYTTLTRVVQGSNTNPIGRDFYSSQGHWGSDIVVIDILPGNPGKEIVAGSMVYGVNLATGAITVLKNLNTINAGVPLNSDGPTAVADLNGDGLLDIVYSSYTTGRVYAWNPQNNSLLLNVPGNTIVANNFAVSEPTIAYVYDDTQNGYTTDFPEIIITTNNRVTAYNLQFPVANNRRVWQFATTDSSGETGITAFDFNGDGVAELIYNDETQIRIINGNLATPANLSTFASGTITWMEHPIVADVDGDGQAEMIAYSGLPNAQSGQGRVNIFNPTAGNVWQPARKVWNQRGYHVVNINDDLTVPIKETSMTNFMPASSTKYRLLNQYNVQFNPNHLLLEPGTVPTPDAQINSLTYNTATNSFQFVIGVTGNANLPAATPITIYNGNPQTTNATIFQTVNTPSQIAPGATLAFSATASAGVNANTGYYAVVNDNGSKPRPFNLATQFPSTGTLECNYVNNIKAVAWDSDGDGIADEDDLDDDNDGILDTTECPTTNVFANLAPAVIANGGTATATVTGIAFGNVNGTLVRALTGVTVGVALVKTTNDFSNSSIYTPEGTATQGVFNEGLTGFNGTANFARYTLTLSAPVESITLHIADWDYMRTRFTGNHKEQLITGGSELEYNSATRQLYDTAPNTVSTVTRDGFGSIKITSTNGLPLTQIVFEKFDDPNTTSGTDGFRYTFSVVPACDTDGDGIPNRLDLDSDADGCSDAIEGGADITVNELVTAAGTVTGGSTAVNQNLCATGTCVDANGIPQYSTLPVGYSNTTGQVLGDSQNILVNSCYCYKKPVLDAGVTVPTKHGITSLNRANSGNNEWPIVRQSAWTVLEAKTKGFVVNRLAFEDADSNPATPMTPAGIAAANYVEGMMVYDTTNNCLKIYNGTVWNCYTTPACPQ